MRRWEHTPCGKLLSTPRKMFFSYCKTSYISAHWLFSEGVSTSYLSLASFNSKEPHPLAAILLPQTLLVPVVIQMHLPCLSELCRCSDFRLSSDDL
jgi:hypothetical protein